jgi:hypothetical protein
MRSIRTWQVTDALANDNAELLVISVDGKGKSKSDAHRGLAPTNAPSSRGASAQDGQTAVTRRKEAC